MTETKDEIMVGIMVIKKEDFGYQVVDWLQEVEVIKKFLGVIHKVEVLFVVGVSIEVPITVAHTIRVHMMVFVLLMQMPRIEVINKLAKPLIKHTTKEPVI